MHSLQAAQQVEETKLPHHPRCLEDDLAMHLRNAGAAIHEHDGDLLDPEPALPAAERDLDLEPVALRPSRSRTISRSDPRPPPSPPARAGRSRARACENT